MPVLRSVMYVPGNKEDMLGKIPRLTSDVITIDLEDSVPPAEKEKARGLAHSHLKIAADTGADVYVRLNNWETGMTNADCEAVVDKGLNAVCHWKLEEMEQKNGLEPGSVQIQLLIETAKGMMNVYEAATASPRVNSLIFGAVDYTTDMRVTLTQPNGHEQEWGRARMACAARAAGLIAIDCPYVAFKDTEGFEVDTRYGRQLGYEGRMLIHPSQIEPAHKIYSPAPERVEWAKAVVKVFEEEGIAKGSAAVTLNGHMVDTPVYLNAKQILDAITQIEEKEKKRKG